MSINIDKIRKDIPLFDPGNNTPYTRNIIDYFQFYGLDFQNCCHCFGYISAENEKIATHLFDPTDKSKSKGLVFLIQGYLDHSSSMKNVIRYLLSKNYSVVAFDLQGHGLSTGERTAVKDFSGYVDTFSSVIDFCSGYIPGPRYFIGHSTGCSVALEYLYTKENIFDKIVFAAPLVRSTKWYLSRIAFFFLGSFLKKLPRLYTKSSNDRKFLNFLKKEDPLQEKRTAVSWVGALFNWYDRLKKYPLLKSDIFIIQGNDDRTVKWRYNIPFLQEKISSSNLHMINGARHHLFNESREYMQQVFKILDRIY